ncbi:QueT transporter family protein [Erysipelatoclostridium sp. AM42-17]|uniref:QueT transporter family protein n=1 Tax=Coprobacillaceae TaxID=2810280 RepID=UPI0026D7117E
METERITRMNKRNSVNLLLLNAMIAAIYAVLTLMLSPISYGEIQCRISEVIVFLAFYNKKYIPGLTVGCIIANLFSPLGMVDICFGTLSTIIVCIAMYKSKNHYVAAALGAIITGIIVGSELAYVYSIPFVINAIYVAIGEAIILFISAFIFKGLEKNNKFISMIKE